MPLAVRKDARVRLLQHRSADGVRRIIVSEGEADIGRFVRGYERMHDLAKAAIARDITLAELVGDAGAEGDIDLTEELAAGRLLTPIDHPDDAHVVVAGTGLTHLGSAEGRDKMHKAVADQPQTDSMRMFLEGVEGGKPAPGEVGQQPEWFYKGDGAHLVAPGAPLTMPHFAQDGGEEPEIAGIYLIDDAGMPRRIGFCLANEFSDHVTEKHNYLWLAHSKLRQASLGAELLIGELPHDLRGSCGIERDGATLWEKPFLTGEDNMAHTIANLEYHHFKYAGFRRPGDIHVHFFGTATASFADGIQTQPGDTFVISAAPQFRLPLRNRLERAEEAPVTVRAL